MALTKAQVREILSEAGIEKENMKDAVEKIIDGHLASIDVLREEADTQKKAAEDARKELDDLRAKGDGGLQKQLDDLQKKYDDDAAAHKAELDALKGQLADRDYTDAIGRAIAGANEGKGLKFSSKAARTAFEAAIREKKLELKDGVLTGFDEFVKAQKEADPDAFASDKPAARFAAPVGVGSKPDSTPANVQMAKAMGAAKAQNMKASNDVFSQYT